MDGAVKSIASRALEILLRARRSGEELTMPEALDLAKRETERRPAGTETVPLPVRARRLQAIYQGLSYADACDVASLSDRLADYHLSFAEGDARPTPYWVERVEQGIDARLKSRLSSRR